MWGRAGSTTPLSVPLIHSLREFVEPTKWPEQGRLGCPSLRCGRMDSVRSYQIRCWQSLLHGEHGWGYVKGYLVCRFIHGGTSQNYLWSKSAIHCEVRIVSIHCGQPIMTHWPVCCAPRLRGTGKQLTSLKPTLSLHIVAFAKLMRRIFKTISVAELRADLFPGPLSYK